MTPKKKWQIYTHALNQPTIVNECGTRIYKKTHTHTLSQTNKQAYNNLAKKKSQKPICLCMCVCLADDDLFFSNVIHKYPQHTNWNH